MMVNLVVVEAYHIIGILILMVGYVPLVVAYRRSRMRWMLLAYTALLVGTLVRLGSGLVNDQVLLLFASFIGVFAASVFFFLSARVSQQCISEIETVIKEKGTVTLE